MYVNSYPQVSFNFIFMTEFNEKGIFTFYLISQINIIESQYYLHGDTFATKIKVEPFETIGNLRSLVSSPAIHESRGNYEEVGAWHNARIQPHATAGGHTHVQAGLCGSKYSLVV